MRGAGLFAGAHADAVAAPPLLPLLLLGLLRLLPLPLLPPPLLLR